MIIDFNVDIGGVTRNIEFNGVGLTIAEIQVIPEGLDLLADIVHGLAVGQNGLGGIDPGKCAVDVLKLLQ